MIEQRPVYDGAEARPAGELSHFVVRDGKLRLHAQPLEKLRIQIRTLNALLNRPFRTLVPVTAGKADRAKLLANRLEAFQQTAHLAPPLPVVTYINHAVALAVRRPDLSGLLRRRVLAGHVARIEAVPEKGAHSGSQWGQRRLKDFGGNCFEALDPLPSLVAVHSLQVIEIVLDADRFVIPPTAIDDDPAILGHAVQQLRQVWHVREIPGFVHHENGIIEGAGV